MVLEIRLTSPIPSDFYNQRVRFSGETLYQPERGELWEACYVEGSIQPLASPDRIVKAKLLIRFREPISLRYGDHLELEGELRQPKGKRNPGGFDYRSYLARRKVFGVLYPKGNLENIPTHPGGFFLWRWTERLRLRVEKVIDLAYREYPNHVQILKGMLLGKRGGIEDSTIAAFRNSGSLHILAVSGLHVGLIAGVCYLGFARLPIKPRWIYFLTIVAVILYASLVGLRPSVFRASLMVILFLFGLIIDRDVDRLNLLAVAALTLLLVNPAQLWDVGFQLSFGAVASIIYLITKWDALVTLILPNQIGQTGKGDIISYLHSVGTQGLRWLLVAFGVTLLAQVGTTLVIARHFYRVYPLGLLAGPFVVGLATPIVSITLISILVGLIWLPLATPFAYFNHFVILILLKIIGFFGQSWGVLRTAPPSLGWIAAYITVCLAVAHWRWVWKEWKKGVLIGMAALAIWIWDAASKAQGNLLEITFLDIGQGDAAFVRFPDGKTVLIDGGRNLLFAYKGQFRHLPREGDSLNFLGFDSGERILDPFLSYEGVRKLDLLLLSHPDNDHGGGFVHVLHEFEVERVLGVPHQDLRASTHWVLHEIIDTKGIPHELGYAGKIDLTSTAELKLLQPLNETSVNLEDRDVNDDSLVLKLSYGEVDILFTGDIERKGELRLIESGQNLEAEFLKVPHHGSRTSSSPQLLDTVRPRYAIFSLGERNRYGFPAEEVVTRYQDRACNVLRTDLLGAIRLRTDGQRCWITGCGEGK